MWIIGLVPVEVCKQCGVAVTQGQMARHTCDPVRQKQFQEAQRELAISKVVADHADKLDEELEAFQRSTQKHVAFAEYRRKRERAA